MLGIFLCVIRVVEGYSSMGSMCISSCRCWCRVCILLQFSVRCCVIYIYSGGVICCVDVCF